MFPCRLYCGAAGMRVWLPLFPRVGESSHAFMARRIMLHFPCHNIYPLRILFDRALMLGVANETQVGRYFFLFRNILNV